MTREPVLHRWLEVAALVTIAVGLVAAAAGSARGAGPWSDLFDLLDWPLDGNRPRFAGKTSAVNAVAGGVMVGWGTLILLVVRGPFRGGDTTLATPVLVSVLAWFTVDSAGSLAADLPGNIVLNVAFLGLFVPPLLVLRKAGGGATPPTPGWCVPPVRGRGGGGAGRWRPRRSSTPT